MACLLKPPQCFLLLCFCALAVSAPLLQPWEMTVVTPIQYMYSYDFTNLTNLFCLDLLQKLVD